MGKGAYKFFKKEDFYYLESKDYVVEFDFALVDFGLVQIAIRPHLEATIGWKRGAREILQNTFIKHYRVAQQVNEFTPVINF